MNPRRLTLRGFRSFADLELDLPTGCVGLVGSNGAGKSSLLHAIEVALFGPRSRSLEPLLRAGDDELLVELEYEHAGDVYRVRRGFVARGRGKSTLDLERLDERLAFVPGVRDREDDEVPAIAWSSLTQGTAADTQAHLERLLGMSRDTWLASAYLEQGGTGAFTEAQPKDRKRILSETLALTVWDDASQAVAADRRAAQGEEQALAGRVAALSERVAAAAALRGEADRLTVCLADADRALAEATGRVAECEEVAGKAVAAVEVWRRAQQDVTTAEQLAAAHRKLAVEAQVALERLDGERSEVARLEPLAMEHTEAVTELAVLLEQDAARARALDEQRRLRQEFATLTEAVGRHEQTVCAIDEKITAASAPDARCDRCGQPLADDAHEAAMASLARERDAAFGALEDARTQAHTAGEKIAPLDVPEQVEGLDDLRFRIGEIDHAPASLAAARARIEELERAAAILDDPAYREENDRLVDAEHGAHDRLGLLDEPEPGAAEQAQAALLTARAAQEAARSEQARVGQELARVDGQLKAAAADSAALDQATADRASLADRLADLEVLERAFGRDGIPQWIIDTHAIPAIETEANRILQLLGGPVTSVELRTEREIKGGGLADALDIVCHTADGARDYSTFSGGERTRIGLALRIALARLLAHRRSADIRLLALDEPEGLDDAGTEALAGILRDLVERDEFTTTVLASHDTNLRDRFDTAILVTAADAGSEAVVA